MNAWIFDGYDKISQQWTARAILNGKSDIGKFHRNMMVIIPVFSFLWSVELKMKFELFSWVLPVPVCEIWKTYGWKLNCKKLMILGKCHFMQLFLLVNFHKMAFQAWIINLFQQNYKPFQSELNEHSFDVLFVSISPLSKEIQAFKNRYRTVLWPPFTVM